VVLRFKGRARPSFARRKETGKEGIYITLKWGKKKLSFYYINGDGRRASAAGRS